MEVLKELALFSSKREGEWVTVLGLVGSVVASWFGGFDKGMYILLGLMAIDYISGMIVAGIFKKSGKTENGGLSSKIGYIGICKKVLILFMIIVANCFDELIGASYARDAVVFTFCANEIVSCLENVGKVDPDGKYVPKVLLDAVDVLRKKGEGKDEADS